MVFTLTSIRFEYFVPSAMFIFCTFSMHAPLVYFINVFESGIKTNNDMKSIREYGFMVCLFLPWELSKT
jgi:hypothetical protein